MTKEALIQKIIKKLAHLPDEKITAILDFADFIAKSHEEDILLKEIASIASNSDTYRFLNEEEDLYTVNDLKTIYK